MSIKRIYHPYNEWEETYSNMWGNVKNKESYLKVAVDFTGNARLYGEHMKRVTKEWKKSCEHNLSNTTQNRRAWIGHAAVALAFGCPEQITREAWSLLSEQQQIDANDVADIAIKQWEAAHLEGLCQNEG